MSLNATPIKFSGVVQGPSQGHVPDLNRTKLLFPEATVTDDFQLTDPNSATPQTDKIRFNSLWAPLAEPLSRIGSIERALPDVGAPLGMLQQDFLAPVEGPSGGGSGNGNFSNKNTGVTRFTDSMTIADYIADLDPLKPTTVYFGINPLDNTFEAHNTEAGANLKPYCHIRFDSNTPNQSNTFWMRSEANSLNWLSLNPLNWQAEPDAEQISRTMRNLTLSILGQQLNVHPRYQLDDFHNARLIALFQIFEIFNNSQADKKSHVERFQELMRQSYSPEGFFKPITDADGSILEQMNRFIPRLAIVMGLDHILLSLTPNGDVCAETWSDDKLTMIEPNRTQSPRMYVKCDLKKTQTFHIQILDQTKSRNQWTDFNNAALKGRSDLARYIILQYLKTAEAHEFLPHTQNILTTLDKLALLSVQHEDAEVLQRIMAQKDSTPSTKYLNEILKFYINHPLLIRILHEIPISPSDPIEIQLLKSIEQLYTKNLKAYADRHIDSIEGQFGSYFLNFNLRALLVALLQNENPSDANLQQLTDHIRQLASSAWIMLTYFNDLHLQPLYNYTAELAAEGQSFSSTARDTATRVIKKIAANLKDAFLHHTESRALQSGNPEVV